MRTKGLGFSHGYELRRGKGRAAEVNYLRKEGKEGEGELIKEGYEMRGKDYMESSRFDELCEKSERPGRTSIIT